MQFGTERTLVRDLVQLKKPDLVLWSTAWIWFICGSIIIFAVTVWTILFSGLDYKASLIVASCSFLGFARGMAPVAWFDYKGKANFQSIILVIDRVLFFISAAIIIFFLKNEKAIIYVSFAQLLCRLITLGIEWNFVLDTTQHIFKPVYYTIKELMRNNIWVWLAGIGNLLMTQINQLILNTKFGPKELANYGLALQIVTIIRLLQTQLLRLMAPSIAEVTANNKNAQQILKKIFRYCGLTFILTLCVILPLYLLSPYIILQFIGKDYLTAVPVLNVLYVWITFYGLALIISQFSLGLLLQRLSFISTSVFGLFSVILAHVFVNQYQSVGAALSLLISHFCSVLFLFFIVLKKIRSAAKATS